MSARQIRTSTEGRLGRLTLDRPEALNALTQGMIAKIGETLADWEADANIAVVLLEGAGDRAFCAGGDIVALRESALGDGDDARRFWRDEYRLNARIAAFAKPVVALMDGITMGGGVGLAGHASHRVVTERVLWAMPEVSIGFAPDVGGTFLLSRAPGELGTHVALTAAKLGCEDVIACGFGDHHVRSSELPGLLQRLRSGDVDAALAAAISASGPTAASVLAGARADIDACYGGERVDVIHSKLVERGSDVTTRAADALAAASPTSLVVTLAGLRKAAALPSLRECLEQEFRTSSSFLDVPDFSEGIRAAVVDKDRKPRWRPSELDAVDDGQVRAMLAGPSALESLF